MRLHPNGIEAIKNPINGLRFDRVSGHSYRTTRISCTDDLHGCRVTKRAAQVSKSLGVWGKIHRLENLSGYDHAGSGLVARQVLILLIQSLGSRHRMVSAFEGIGGVTALTVCRHIRLRLPVSLIKQLTP